MDCLSCQLALNGIQLKPESAEIRQLPSSSSQKAIGPKQATVWRLSSSVQRGLDTTRPGACLRAIAPVHGPDSVPELSLGSIWEAFLRLLSCDQFLVTGDEALAVEKS
jgi:hypothetical protein